MYVFLAIIDVVIAPLNIIIPAQTALRIVTNGFKQVIILFVSIIVRQGIFIQLQALIMANL